MTTLSPMKRRCPTTLSLSGQSLATNRPKDSLNRFGDDLCQLLLSFLPFSDCFRYELVSKQWQRVIFAGQEVLTIDDQLIATLEDITAFDLLLKKCANVTSIKLIAANETRVTQKSLIESITRHCRHLTDILFILNKPIDWNSLDEFFARFSKQLKSCYLRLHSKEDSQELINTLNKYVMLCPNIREIHLKTNQNLYKKSVTDVVFGKLKKVLITCYANDTHFELFVDKYGQQIQSVDVIVGKDCQNSDIDVLVTGLSRMSSLIILSIDFRHSWDISSIFTIKQLMKININCPKLKSLTLAFETNSAQYCQHLIQTINDNFQRLKHLSLTDYTRANSGLSLRSIENLKQLQDLCLICNKYNIDNNFFDNIESHLPRLQCVRMADIDVNDNILRSLSRLKHLKHVMFIECRHELNDKAIAEFTKNCSKLTECTITKPDHRWTNIHQLIDQLPQIANQLANHNNDNTDFSQHMQQFRQIANQIMSTLNDVCKDHQIS
ncbi:uncharacterized protein LOC128955127 [Oppia nitens]|uniref:uncharacterized protein LOC128955127 n=1 Tax=Oppia nitens TaxID=1686743 RepID=UPI0023DB8993|nr:uncharacterized protein LOC128955127 [Oppia nitens]XP_054156744.1 uncharacterized protein LOC128955127 [Oppia nitens]